LAARSLFFLFFVLSYVVLAFIFYFYFVASNSSARYFSNLGTPLNRTLSYIFFLLPLLSLGGGAPSLAFFYKLSFLLTNLQEDSFFLLSLYILSIVVSVVFYFQLFKANTVSYAVTQKSKPPVVFNASHNLVFYLSVCVLVLSTPLLGPTSFYLLESFSRLSLSLWSGL
jgi:NADH:ubiquinone oxidoreductase subunit 2 (subunit N)